MQTHQIIISKIARKDLLELFTYITENDIPAKAFIIQEELLKKIETLSFFPERGQYICKHDDMSFYEIYFKIYRIVYTIIDNNVTIYGVVDCRRDFKNLLLKRLSTLTRELP